SLSLLGGFRFARTTFSFGVSGTVGSTVFSSMKSSNHSLRNRTAPHEPPTRSPDAGSGLRSPAIHRRSSRDTRLRPSWIRGCRSLLPSPPRVAYVVDRGHVTCRSIERLRPPP